MLNTESTPLVKSNNKKPKSTTICIICLTISIIALITIFYHKNVTPSAQNISHIELTANINDPALLKTRYPKYPTDSILKKYRTMTRIIEYKSEELPQKTDLTDFDSTKMRQFHTELIQTHGYDNTIHNIIFSVSDPPLYESDILTDETAKDKLTCKYLYSYASTTNTDEENGRFMEVNCPTDYVITGCTSFSRYSSGIRWGELAYETSDCFTHTVSSIKPDLYGTLLTASCCKVDNSIAQLHATYTTSVTSNSDFCVETECPIDMVSIGCTATDSHQATDKFSGTKWIRNTHFLSGCKAQRSDLGYLWQTAYCAQLQNSDNDLICMSQNGNKAIEKEYGDYESVAICNGHGYVMTDCNGYIKHEIDYCTAGKAYGNDFGVLYGSYMLNGEYASITTTKRPICFAVGNTDSVVAEAICCKIK